LVASSPVRDEISKAPDPVQELFREMRSYADFVRTPPDAVQLQQSYLDAGIVGADCAADALHVALATVVGCSMIVSWNFKHIVNYQRIPLFNGVNLFGGYAEVAIYSPWEMIGNEEG
jgi:hypothetical protein